jgi:hypothetical protein
VVGVMGNKYPGNLPTFFGAGSPIAAQKLSVSTYVHVTWRRGRLQKWKYSQPAIKPEEIFVYEMSLSIN